MYHGAGTSTWLFHTELCKFLRNIPTNISSLGKRTGPGRRSSAPWTLQSTKLKDDWTTRRGLHFAIVAHKLNLYLTEYKKKKNNFYCTLNNKSVYVLGLHASNGSWQLSATVYLPCSFNFRSPKLFLLLTCFWVVVYAMLLGDIESISRVEPFDRVITYL